MNKKSSPPATPSSTAQGPQSSGLPETQQLFFLLDQKLEQLRSRTDLLLAEVHQDKLANQTQESRLNQQIQQQTLALKELESQLQYLSHKTLLQIKDIENANSQFKRDVEARMQDIHFATREELSSLSRRLEVLEKLIL